MIAATVEPGQGQTWYQAEVSLSPDRAPSARVGSEGQQALRLNVPSGFVGLLRRDAYRNRLARSGLQLLLRISAPRRIRSPRAGQGAT